MFINKPILPFLKRGVDYTTAGKDANGSKRRKVRACQYMIGFHYVSEWSKQHHVCVHFSGKVEKTVT